MALFICKPGQVSSPLKLIQVLWINMVPELTCIQTQQLFLTFVVMYGNIISLITDCKGNSFVFLRICLGSFVIPQVSFPIPASRVLMGPTRISK